METWFCVRCRAVNTATAVICHGCRAPREMSLVPTDQPRKMSVQLPLPKSLKGKLPEIVDVPLPSQDQVERLRAVKLPRPSKERMDRIRAVKLPRPRLPSLRRPQTGRPDPSSKKSSATSSSALSFSEQYRGTQFDPGFSPAAGRSRRRRRLIAGGLVGVLGLAALGGVGAMIALGGGQPPATTASGSPGPSGSQDPGPTATPTPVPTATPEIHPIVAGLVAIFAEPDFRGRWEVVTTLEAGATVQELTRLKVERSGNDDHTQSSILADADGSRETLETVQLGDKVYQRPGPGSPWTARTRKAADKVAVPLSLDLTSKLVYDGRAKYQGERLHRIVDERLARDLAQEFEDSLASRDAKATDAAASVLVRNDGMPVVMIARVEGALDDGATPVVFTLTTTYQDIGAPIEISLESAAGD